MKSSDLDRFVRLPTDLLEVLLRAHLSGAQLRIVLWVLRYTFGWNRQSTPFSWYRIAKELQMPRSAVYRAGKRLAQSKVLVVQERQLTIQTDYTAWNDAVLFRTLATLRVDLPVFETVDALRWKQARPCFEALCQRMKSPELFRRATALAGSQMLP